MTFIVNFFIIIGMNYNTLLKDHHLKATPQRIGILEVMHTYGHISVENLFVEVKKQFSSISLATLYKNITSMLENSLITEVKAPENKVHYEITKKPHAHFVCTECGEHKDINFDLENICGDIVDKKLYEVNNTSVILSGKCPNCK